MLQLQNAHLTFKGNQGRHRWLRLTPAYSVKLVRDYVAALPPGSVVTDPFSGTGTTALAAAEHALVGQGMDINPFLIWLAEAKTRHYTAEDLQAAHTYTDLAAREAHSLAGYPDLWQPALSNIERWWAPGVLSTLSALRAALDRFEPGPARDLLDVAFCRVIIATSAADFSHQSMSFKPVMTIPRASAIDLFRHEVGEVVAGAATDLSGTARFARGDSRVMDAPELEPCDLLVTSPPYVNRISYIRELRPYMYWLRFLDTAPDAADLDWSAIGGTWGSATSRLATWSPQEETPLARPLEEVCARVAADGDKSGRLLANYVRRYFADVWSHAQAAFKHVVSGGRAIYIVGNSTFYGNVVPAEEWYAVLLREAGFTGVTVQPIRKRNSKRELFEYAVTAHRP